MFKSKYGLWNVVYFIHRTRKHMSGSQYFIWRWVIHWVIFERWKNHSRNPDNYNVLYSLKEVEWIVWWEYVCYCEVAEIDINPWYDEIVKIHYKIINNQ